MNEIKIWHNNRCSKSRGAKQILEELNVPYGTFEYLNGSFTINDIKDIMKKLGITDVKDMIRKKEKEYIELDIENRSQEEIINILVTTPNLVERPIVIKGDKAVIARPVENIYQILNKADEK